MVLKALNLTLFIFLLTGASSAFADFIQTSPSVFQADDLRTKVISSDAGILIIRTRDPVDLQTFNPSLVMSEGTHNAFIKYDRKRKVFSELLSTNKSYLIKGSFGFSLDGVRVRLDNYSNPYLTIISESKTSKPSILGFLALTAVVNFSSNEAVALLEANQSFSKISDIQPYDIDEDGQIFLKKKKLSTNTIGLNIPLPNNQCLKNEKALFVSENIFKKVSGISDTERRSEIIANIRKIKNQTDFLSQLIILKAQKNIIAFEPEQSLLFEITPLSLEAETGLQEEVFCVYQKIEFSGR